MTEGWTTWGANPKVYSLTMCVTCPTKKTSCASSTWNFDTRRRHAWPVSLKQSRHDAPSCNSSKWSRDQPTQSVFFIVQGFCAAIAKAPET
ncbi:hypothetical protein IG631_15583 [Alternaria alternata]|nr:hypothetical protein IG631_15583 [Alternaria alternata]